MRYAERILRTPPSFIREILKVAEQPDVISFAGGLPNPAAFPTDALRLSAERAVRREGHKLFQYAATEGYPPLREYLAEKYRKKHGLNIGPEDVLITGGSQQALDLLGKTLISKGDGVIVEAPGYLGGLQAFSLYEPTFLPVPLAPDGPDLDALEAAAARPGVACFYTVPNFQNPTGATYSAAKRRAVREILDRRDILLIEDDPYGELRFRGTPLPYMSADRLERGVLLGTFSKTVAPGMRLGWLITANRELMRFLTTAKQAGDLHTSVFCQGVVHDYLTNNDYEEHVASIVRLYGPQQETMLRALRERFPASARCAAPDGGMFLWVALEDGLAAVDVFAAASRRKVAFVPGDPFYTDRTRVNTLRLNFTNTSPEGIRTGMRLLGEAVRECAEKKRER